MRPSFRLCLVSAVCLAFAPGALLPGARGAEEEAATPGQAVKALLDERLQDWGDAGSRQAVLRMMHDVFPARLAELEEVLSRSRDEAQGIAGELIEQSSRLVDLKEGEPLEYERFLRQCRLEDECLALGRKARSAEGAAREALLGELRTKLGEVFDARQEAMARDLAAMEAEVEAARRRLAKRAENRQILIERRVLDLLGDREAEW